MKNKVESPFLFGHKVTSRVPRKLEMTVVVRAVFRLRPGEPVTPIADPVDQGFLCGDRFAEDDEERAGALLHADDFADFKLKADVLFRGSCHPGRPARDCTVRFGVGGWSKSLRVVGRRVWTERVLDPISTPAPFTVMPMLYQHAFGGPGYAQNPSGMGHATIELPNIEAVDKPVTSRHRAMDPAGFGPISPNWPQRKKKLGTDYGADWKKNRAPYYSADFDWSFFNAAPPDQQIDGYLRGDEELYFENLHPADSRFRTRLPAIGPRVLVRYGTGEIAHVVMKLDTLLADLEDEKLALIWRGLTPVASVDLDDVSTLFIAGESLTEKRRSEDLVAELMAFEADPLERDKVVPGDVKKRIADARAAAEAAIAEQKKAAPAPSADPMDRMAASIAAHTGDQPPEERARIAEGLERLRASTAANQTAAAAWPTLDTPSPTLEAGRGEHLKNIAKAKDLAASRGAPTARFDSATATIQAAQKSREADLAKLDAVGKQDPRIASILSVAKAANGQAPAEPGPGVNLMDRDLSGRDLRGVSLEGALLRGANLSGANLSGANLSRADLGNTDLTEADLTGADLSQAILVGARAPRAKLDGANLSRAMLQDIDLTEASLRKTNCPMAMFVKAKLKGATLVGAKLERTLFSESDIEGLDLTEADIAICTFLRCEGRGLVVRDARLAKTTFLESKLEGADFSGTRGTGSSFQLAVLDGADFTYTHLRNTQFPKTSMVGTKMFAADLAGSRFDRAKLERADLEKANLLRASFDNADLSEARFTGANLYDAKFFGAKAAGKCDFTGANLTLAAWGPR